MKATGMKLLDMICYLEQLSVISSDERIEYANLIGLAMRPGYEHYFTLLKNKLKQKAKTCSNKDSDYLDSALALFDQDTI